MTQRLPETAGSVSVPILIPALLIMASAVSILSTDLYTPSLPHLQGVFHTDAGRVQLTMTLNLVAYALAQLFYGPLSDRIGRRPVLLAGMIGFAVASMGCAAAGSIESLIAARVLQGLTACAEAVVGYAVIRELYDEAGAVRVLAAYGMAIALAPAVGPVVGGHMHVWFGWRSNFILLTGLIVLVILLIWRFLPETLKQPDRGALRPRRLLRGYLTLLRDGPFMTYTLIMSLVLGGLFAILTAFPFVFIERLAVPTEQYGYYYAAIVVAFFLGSLVVNRVAGRFASDPLLMAGLGACLLGGLGFTILLLSGLETPVRITATQCFFGFGLGLVFATAPVRAFDVCRAGHGHAAAMLGALPMAGGGLGTFCVVLWHDGSAWPVAMILTLTALMGTAMYLVIRPWRVRAGHG
ncbi:MAG: multidrug effflux MFS transporter [Alphaproteobacteria bacterium]|nr:multidrug effflux MFS transporter [Alphaproteobacteria bacterium]